MNSVDWQPIETAPKDGTAILLYDGQIRVGWWGSDSYDLRATPTEWLTGDAIFEGEHHYYATVDNPTHWMSLPDKPQ